MKNGLSIGKEWDAGLIIMLYDLWSGGYSTEGGKYDGITTVVDGLRGKRDKHEIADKNLDYFLGNVIKYVSRAGRKGDYIEDLLKARAYLDKAIDLEHERRITSCSE